MNKRRIIYFQEHIESENHKMAKRKTKFMCQECGYESPKWMGKCPGCGAWNKMVEEVEKAQAKRRAFAHSEDTAIASKPTSITAIEINEAKN